MAIFFQKYDLVDKATDVERKEREKKKDSLFL
jgi:hypothetical protein